jgi:pimeloyl-ACP methyl ester carboxylesterase
MWSDPVGWPRTGAAVAADLHEALQAAKEQGPYVMVGASLGGPYVMIFTQHYGAEVAGLVFVDAAHPEQTRRMQEAIGREDDESIPLVFRLLARLAWTGLPRLLLPEPSLPELPTHVGKQIAAYQSTSLQSAFDEAAAMESILREAGAFRNLGDRPLAVLTRGKPYDAYSEAQRAGAGMTREQFERREQAWSAMQDEEASWSSRSTHRRLEDSSHVIQLERPDAVIDAIREVVEKLRARPLTLR